MELLLTKRIRRKAKRHINAQRKENHPVFVDIL